MSAKLYMFDSDGDPDVIGPMPSTNGERNGSSFFTPSKNPTQERVFKTPMTFSPRLVGDQVKPSPSRMELWKEQLGLDDTAVHSQSDSDQSMDDEDDEKENQDRNGYCSVIEFQAMQRELDERNKQRDDLLFRIKTLTDKNKQYQQRIEKEENSKKQQIKIIKKTHETRLQEKENLIKNLEDIIQELETKQSNSDDGILGESSGPVTKVIEQISVLQSQKSDISTQLLDAQLLIDSQKDEILSLRSSLATSEEKSLKLEEELLTLNKPSKGSDRSEADRQMLRQEQEIERLHRELETLTALQSKRQVQNGITDTNAEITKKLKEDNDSLQSQLQGLDAQLQKVTSVAEKSENKLKKEIRMLTSDNQALSQEVRTVSAKLTALQARSPEIVTKIQKVEVENPGAQEELERTRKKLTNSTSQISSMCKELTQCKSKCDEVNNQLLAAEQQLESLSHTAAENEQLHSHLKKCAKKIEELEKTKESQAQAAQSEIETLQALCDERQKLIAQNSKDLQSMEDKIKMCEEELVIFKKESEHKTKNLRETMEIMKIKLSETYPALKALAAEYITLKMHCEKLPGQMKTLIEQGTKQLCQALTDISEYNQELIRKYRKEMMLRKKYHNEIVELKGNIRVFCRLRPKIKEDGGGANAQLVCECDKDDDGLVNVMYKSRPQVFEVDRVFSAQSTQIEVFNEVQPLVTSCVDGYNVCIFAYGQTGSGKTHTMEGPKSNPGINQRALKELFRETGERSQEWSYTISVSCIEIYNECIRDLLGSDPNGKLDVKMNPAGGVHVPGLNQYEVNSVDDVNQVFKIGQENRSTAATNMNEHSSRSHALLCVEVVGANSTTGARTLGKLNLVDLAGSERVSKSGADGARLKEAQNINKSLSCLGDVIHALRSKQAHIPYRNSRLTYLLQDSLGGDSKTLMIVQVSPVEKNVGESVASLNFAQRVRSVELGQASKKVESGDAAEGSPGVSNSKYKNPRRK